MDFHEMFESFIDGYGFDPDWVSDSDEDEEKDRKRTRHDEDDEYDVPDVNKSEGDWGP